MEFYLDTTIDELYKLGYISTRTFNCFHYAEMETLGVILDNIEKPIDLLKLRNFGKKSVAEFEIVLNMTKKIHSIGVDSKDNLLATYGAVVAKIIKEAYINTTEGEGDVKAYLRAAYPEPINLHNLIIGNLNNMLNVVEDFSINENMEIRYSFKHYIELVLNGLIESKQAIGNKIYLEYKHKETELSLKIDKFTYEQIANNFLSPVAKEYLERIYKSLVESKLSVRSQNFISQYLPNYIDLIRFAEKPLSSYYEICPGRKVTKTLTEIFHFNQNFITLFDKVSKLTDAEIQSESLKIDYPFLDGRQRKFVIDFYKEYNHKPLFFLLHHFLRLSDNRSDIIYCLFYGIFDGEHRTLIEIGKALNLSRERVRQILNGSFGVQKSHLANENDWESYKVLLNQPYILENNEDYLRIKNEEHLSFDFFVFSSLVKLLFNYNIVIVEGHSFLINNKLEDINISDSLDALYSIINGKYSADTYVPIDSLLFTKSEQSKTSAKTIIKYVATNIYKVEITEDDKIFMPQNFIDIAEELYDILSKKGEPMHVEDIFNEFKKRYPEHKYTDPMQIKPFLYKQKHIRAIGKSSRYALDIWENVYFGSIRDLLLELLNASDLPMHIDILYDGVNEYYPNTTKASVSATMDDENLQRFVSFEGGYYGLVNKNYPSNYVVAQSKQRYSFDERFQMFKDFVDTYHRFPSYNGSDCESSITHWLYNITNNIVSVTDEQRSEFDKMLNLYDKLGYPRTITEYEFLTKCQDIKDYITKNHELPTNKKAPDLYAWIRRSRDNFNSYTDKRRIYMTDLINYILSLGFSI